MSGALLHRKNTAQTTRPYPLPATDPSGAVDPPYGYVTKISYPENMTEIKFTMFDVRQLGKKRFFSLSVVKTTREFLRPNAIGDIALPVARQRKLNHKPLSHRLAFPARSFNSRCASLPSLTILLR